MKIYLQNITTHNQKKTAMDDGDDLQKLSVFFIPKASRYLLIIETNESFNLKGVPTECLAAPLS